MASGHKHIKPDTKWRQITNLYAKRMQIEESFRDLKSPAYGLALRHNRTRCTRRIDILLLMALMAEIIMWWNGLIAMQAKWHYDFQANTIKPRRVLSIPRLGKEVRSHRRYRIQEPNITGLWLNINASHVAVGWGNYEGIRQSRGLIAC